MLIEKKKDGCLVGFLNCPLGSSQGCQALELRPYNIVIVDKIINEFDLSDFSYSRVKNGLLPRI
jgi:hypothetical protein